MSRSTLRLRRGPAVMGLLVVSLIGAAIAHAVTINGTQYEDCLLGTQLGDSMYFKEGDDKGYGLEGNDDLFGHDGRDKIGGNEGADFISGGNGADSGETMAGFCSGGVTPSTELRELAGGPGNDRIEGGPHADRILGNGGNDNLLGQDDPDNIWAEDQEADTVNGGYGNDTCHVDGYDTVISCETVD